MASSKNDNTRYRKGMWAEWAACALLFIKNYRIIARRWRTPMGEIDILAAKGDTLVLVEVKYRTSIAAALESVSLHQQQRLMRAANYAAARYPRYAVRRWDMIAIAPWAWPQHTISVWAEEI